MLLIELTAPAGALDDTARARVAARLTREVMHDPSAPESVLAAGRALTHVVFNEPAGWFADAAPVAAGGPLRWLVRITVPESWLEAAPVLIARVSTVLSREGADGAGADAWVQVAGVPEGGLGLHGRALGPHDLVRVLTDPYRAGVGTPPPGTDPVCGMRADPATAPHTLEVDGTAYGFCSAACRAVFAEDHGVPA